MSSAHSAGHLSALLQLAVSPPLLPPPPPPQTRNPVLLSFTHPKGNTGRHHCRGDGSTEHLHHATASFLAIFLLLLLLLFFSSGRADERGDARRVALRRSSRCRPRSHLHPERICLRVAVQVSCHPPGWKSQRGRRCGSGLDGRLRESRRHGPHRRPRELRVRIGAGGLGADRTWTSATRTSSLQVVRSFSNFQSVVGVTAGQTFSASCFLSVPGSISMCAGSFRLSPRWFSSLPVPYVACVSNILPLLIPVLVSLSPSSSAAGLPARLPPRQGGSRRLLHAARPSLCGRIGTTPRPGPRCFETLGVSLAGVLLFTGILTSTSSHSAGDIHAGGSQRGAHRPALSSPSVTSRALLIRLQAASLAFFRRHLSQSLLYDPSHSSHSVELFFLLFSKSKWDCSSVEDCSPLLPLLAHWDIPHCWQRQSAPGEPPHNRCTVHGLTIVLCDL